MTDQIMAAVAALDANHARMAELQSRLKSSLRLEEFVPGCFDHGGCTTRVIANMWNPGKARFVVTLGNGSEIEKPLLDIPFDLWGPGAQADYLSTDRMNQRRWDRHILGRGIEA